MSKFEQKPGFGSLFREENKKSPNGPDYRGSVADLNGVQYELAGWLKEGKTGTKYLSLKMQLPREQAASKEPQEFAGDLNDEVPW